MMMMKKMMVFVCMVVFYVTIIMVPSVHSVCQDTVVDLNTATIEELDKLQYITPKKAEKIISFRPLCSPSDLAEGPKKIKGITPYRVMNYWGDCAVASCRSGPSCSNNKRDGDESDVDCGGSCSACGLGMKCGAPSDCSAGLKCVGSVCQKPPPPVDPSHSKGLEADASQGAEQHVSQYTEVPSNVFIRRRGQSFRFAARNDGAGHFPAHEALVQVRWAEDIGRNSVVPWKSNVQQSPHNREHVWITVDVPVNAPVGRYAIDVKRTTTGVIVSYELIILFNPWSSHDVVSAKGKPKSFLDEYVMNTEGLIWTGNSEQLNAGPVWDYGQFLYKNLDTALTLLDRLSPNERSDIVHVARFMSHIIGSHVCYGRWSGSMTSGRPAGGYKCSSRNKCVDPLTWHSSTDILDLHRHVGRQAQYCQCFNFAGLFTTLARTLGIPARPVSNFQSAHDTHRNRGIEKFYYISDEGTYEPHLTASDEKTADSVWDVHVWTELYYSGKWNMADATPQEPSEGLLTHSQIVGDPFMMGPVPIDDVRQLVDRPCKKGGNVLYGCWDNEFAISEVNSNVHLWVCEKNCLGPINQVKFALNGIYPYDPFDETRNIGQLMSTKKVGPISRKCRETEECDAEREDVTLKYKDGTGDYEADGGSPTTRPQPKDNEDFDTYMKRVEAAAEKMPAVEFIEESGGSNAVVQHTPTDIEVSVSSAKGMFLYHQQNELRVHMNVQNNGKHTLLVHAVVVITGQSYDNVRRRAQIFRDVKHFNVDRRGQRKSHTFAVPFTHIAQHLNAQAQSASERVTGLRIFVSARVTNVRGEPTGQLLAHERTTRICYPVRHLRSGTVCEGGGRWTQGAQNEIIKMKSLKQPRKKSGGQFNGGRATRMQIV